MPLRLLPLFVAVACAGSSSTEGDTSGGDSAGGGGHPLAPDEYEASWDVNATGCTNGAILYWAFDGRLDEKGKIAGEETWYWFFSEEGWDADCADVFDISAKSATNPLSNDPCNSCDMDFTGTMAIQDDHSSCNNLKGGYEALLDNDDVDRIDEEKFNIVLMLDTNPLGGDPGETQLWSYVQDDQSSNSYFDRSIGLGTYTPDDPENMTGAGDLTWARSDGLCLEIKEG